MNDSIEELTQGHTYRISKSDITRPEITRIAGHLYTVIDMTENKVLEHFLTCEAAEDFVTNLTL